MSVGASILLVEDDYELANSICAYLKSESFNVTLERDGLNAVETIVEQQPDLVILDLMLPHKDGLTICREARPYYQGYVLMLTAKDDEIDQIVGLEVGADDYLLKPIKPRLLLAKINAFLRRKPDAIFAEKPSGDLQFGDLIISEKDRIAMLDSVELALTSAEFELLLLLAQQAGEVLSRDDIAMALSGQQHDGLERTIDNKVSSLRRKINDDARAPRKIKTIRGKGYVLIPSAF